ncbi:MAG TPA: hypothetical protein VGF28_02940 [Thermoanaerobaculia bacterium]|jgi:hypothetical protein
MRVLSLVSLIVSLFVSLSIHAQSFEQITDIRLHEQQASVRGAAMGGVSDGDPVLNPAAVGGVTRTFFSISGVQLDRVDDRGLAHALAVMPAGDRLVVAAHYRGNPRVHGPATVLLGNVPPGTLYIPRGDMYDRTDRRYGVSAAWTSGNVSVGAGAELHELDERAAVGLTILVDGMHGDLVVARLTGRELVPNAGIRWRVTPRVALAAAYNGGGEFARVIDACRLVGDQPIRCSAEHARLFATKQPTPSAMRASITISPLENLTVTGEAVRRNYAAPAEARPFLADPLRDVTELRAGAEYRIRAIALRAGWWTDPTRYTEPEYVRLFALGRRQNHVTFGAGVDVGRARLEFAVDDAEAPALRRAVAGVTFGMR